MLNPLLLRPIIQAALTEDLGQAGDLTTQSLIPASRQGEAILLCKATGIVCGLPVAEATFQEVGATLTAHLEDGAHVNPGDEVATVRGPLAALLTGERVALNWVQHLSGVATATHQMVERIADTKARLVDTRKTLPGLRALQKYAVRVGGGTNHRFGLYDAVMIKDNHLAAVGSLTEAVRRVRSRLGHMVTIQVECDTLEQVKEALEAGVRVLLLDNMGPPLIRQAVALINGRAVVEASGGITLSTIRAIAEAGVDYISVGALTHSAPALDFSLDLLN